LIGINYWGSSRIVSDASEINPLGLTDPVAVGLNKVYVKLNIGLLFLVEGGCLDRRRPRSA